MATDQASTMTLTEADLRAIDETILDYLNERAVTPAYVRRRLGDDGQDYSRGYIHERLGRLEEHGYVTNLLDTGLYELVRDPRDNDSEH